MHTGFGAWLVAKGYPRLSPHRGVDVAARLGADVLAAADGLVTVARDNRDLCALIVVIDHDPYGLRTVYCHFTEIAVRVGGSVRRGQRIGAVSTSGQRAWPDFEHVHLELQKGKDLSAIEDPTARIAGCFDETTAYPADRLDLTYPVFADDPSTETAQTPSDTGSGVLHNGTGDQPQMLRPGFLGADTMTYRAATRTHS